MQDREVMYFLQTTNGIGKKTIQRLWSHFGSGAGIYAAAEQELKSLLQPSQLRTFLRDREKRCLSDELHKLQQRGITYYSVWDKEYPKRLRMIEDRPNGLFVRGSLPAENQLVISIVGTRKHSYYGEKYTRQFAGLLAERGIPIVSGMARGIDGIAQQTAIANGGSTYAVLGCGVDICYPQEHKKLYNQILSCGGIISEYPPGTMPAPGLFPMRNRIISGLCDVLFVMEAREKSGTLITVDMALEQGKEVWVLPGRVDDVLSKGCNRLIAQGAGILPEAMEFVTELDGLILKYGSSSIGNEKSNRIVCNGNCNEKERFANDNFQDKAPRLYDNLSPLEKKVMKQLDYQPCSLSSIYEKVMKENDSEYSEEVIVKNNGESAGEYACSIQQISTALVDLCMKNIAKQMNGNYYIRC